VRVHLLCLREGEEKETKGPRASFFSLYGGYYYNNSQSQKEVQLDFHFSFGTDLTIMGEAFDSIAMPNNHQRGKKMDHQVRSPISMEMSTHKIEVCTCV